MKENHDLCLMDIDMPVMNGIEATQLIRRKNKIFSYYSFDGQPDIYE